MNKIESIFGINPSGDVLQIGKDPQMGEAIQKQAPKSHTIIEFQIEKLAGLGTFHTIIAKTDAAETFVRKEKELFAFAQEKIPELFEMRYSDKELAEFLEALAPSQKKQASIFLSELKNGAQITEEQYAHAVEKYNLTAVSSTPVPQKTINPIFNLVMQCLRHHMLPDSRFVCIMPPGSSCYEDPDFFEHIITNPALSYQETSTSNFNLFLIEKLADV